MSCSTGFVASNNIKKKQRQFFFVWSNRKRFPKQTESVSIKLLNRYWVEWATLACSNRHWSDDKFNKNTQKQQKKYECVCVNVCIEMIG